MMNKNIIQTKWLDVDIGLFPPLLTYHLNDYGDNDRLVISLIVLKLYIVLPFRHTSTYDHYDVYGAYFEPNPDRLIFIWGQFCKKWVMPWASICKRRVLLDRDGVPLYELDGEDNIISSCVTHDCIQGCELDYYVVKNIYTPHCMRKTNWFNKERFEVFVEFKNSVNGYKKISFITPYNILITNQIEVYILTISQPF